MKYLHLFYTFLKIGGFSFGGGYAMLPLIEKEIIYNNQWIDQKSFIDIIATSQITPGPIAINSATFIGYKIGGVFGSLVSTLGVILIPTLMILILSKYVIQFKNSKLVEAIFIGLRPALVGLILTSSFSIGRTAITNVYSLIIFFIVLLIINKAKIHPIIAIISSGVLGYIMYGLI